VWNGSSIIYKQQFTYKNVLSFCLGPYFYNVEQSAISASTQENPIIDDVFFVVDVMMKKQKLNKHSKNALAVSIRQTFILVV